MKNRADIGLSDFPETGKTTGILLLRKHRRETVIGSKLGVFMLKTGILILLCVFWTGSLFAEEPFQPYGLEEAKKVAAEQNKPIFIDFSATWCSPCRRMDQVTWTDQAVRDWLKEKTVPLKIDPLKDPDLAKQYGVNSYPMMMFLDAEAEVMDVLSGFHDAPGFLEAAKTILKFGGAEKRLDDAAKKAGNNLSAHRKLLSGYSRLPNKERAFEFLEDFWRKAEAQKTEASHSDWTQVTRAFRELGNTYPPAQAFLTEKVGLAKTQSEKHPNDLDTLNHTLNLLQNSGPRKKVGEFLAEALGRIEDHKIRKKIAEQHFLELFEAKAFQDIGTYVDLARRTKSERETYLNPKVPNQENLTPEIVERDKQAYQWMAKIQLGMIYQVYKGLDQAEAAHALVYEIPLEARDAELLNFFAWTGYESGMANESDLKMAEEAYNLSKGQDSAILDTYARLLIELGHSRRAQEVLSQAETTFTTAKDQEIIQACKDLLVKR